MLRTLLALPEQAGTFARDLDALHGFVIGVTMVGWIGISLVTFWFLVRDRRPAGAPCRRTPQVRLPLGWELAIVGGLLGVFMLWWAIGFRQYVWMRNPPLDALPVYVTAKQWMWKFSGSPGFRSTSVLVVPTGRPVKLLMTSQDVIHSFIVPAFRIKQDVLPGRYTMVWFEAIDPGVYPIHCTEYCGLQHSRMLGEVVALGPADYERWLEQGALEAGPQPDPAGGVVDRGRDLAVGYGCLGCHSVDGRRHLGPTWRGLFGSRVPLAGGGEALADEAYLTRSMMTPLAELVHGYAPIMPRYQGLLEPGQVGALVEYIKSLRAGAPP
jgi:cytochrome c oxidase subunit 2